MAIGRDEAQYLPGLAVAEERDRYFPARIGHVDALERERVARSFPPIHKGFEAPVVDPVNRLGRDQRSLGFRFRRIHIGEKIGKQRNQVKRNQNDSPADGELVPSEAPPNELPLRGDGDPVFGDHSRHRCRNSELRHHSLPKRILGSTHMSSRSEMSVPMTLITPSSRMMVPARNISWAINALSSSGPTVGRLNTSD